MTVSSRPARQRGPAASGAAPAPRVGLFGLLGSGNIGNDASLDAVLGYLRSYQPDAVLDAMCMGSEQVRTRYGFGAIPLLWFQRYEERASGVTAAVLKALGKVIDPFRTASWVRRHDVVIVPGMGVLEASVPLHPWGVPYTMFQLSASGRLFGTKVALVGVGADVIRQPATRWLLVQTARLAFYRSYRDAHSRDALRQQGVDTSADPVHPDLVFSLPSPPAAGSPETVGVGLMAYHGSNDDRKRGDEIYASYIGSVESFIRWLLESGRRVLLFYGDAVDEPAVQQVLSDLREYASDPRRPRHVLRRTAPGDGARRYRRGDALPQRDLRATAQQADHIARVRGEERRADGGHGTARVLPARRLDRRRKADRAVHEA